MQSVVERSVSTAVALKVMVSLSEIVTNLDNDEHIHLGRLLVLLSAFDRGETGRPAVQGITKLAKLDFLLRYPTYFERAMLARAVNPKRICIEEYERKTVEAQMVRYRYGPWDHRYRRFLNILAAKGLVNVETSGRTILLSLTERGKHYATRIGADPAYRLMRERAFLLRQRIDISATEIMNFIYKVFPEITTLSYDEAIA
jgi:hypothetical protein